MSNKKYDVIIIGGSYAGLSAAMSLGRLLRKVLIIDNNLPCNRQTPHSHNFLTQDGEEPYEIAKLAKQQVAIYKTIEFYNGLAVDGKKIDEGFEITTNKNETFYKKKLIFASGIKDIFPNIKGFSDCWGISVIHCPYCHGYEFKHQTTGIVANGEKAIHLASIIRNLTDKLSIITSGKANFTDEQFEKLKENNIEIIEKSIVEIEHENGLIKQLIFEDGEIKKYEAVYAPVEFKQNTNIPKILGCEFDENGYIKVNQTQTNIKGIFACGDNSTRMRSVANAVGMGNLAGSMVNNELILEEF